MKTALLLSLSLLSCLSSSAREVTFLVNSNHPCSLVLGSNETAKVVYKESPRDVTEAAQVLVHIEKDGLATDLGPAYETIAGPARLTYAYSARATAVVTVQITPDPFPPGATIIINQGEGAMIMMECSTNLVDWVSVQPGVFTNAPAPAQFFRLRADKLP